MYNFYEEQFFYLIFFVCFSFCLTLLLLIISIILSSKKSNFEKNSPYECGFEPFGDSHLFFNISFFIVGILFLIFDLELIFILP
jgi:NADH-quinone oxidoreductase subunit A